MRRYKSAFIIIGSVSGSGDRKVFTEAYKHKEDAEACLKDMGCVYSSPFWEKDNMIYSVHEIHVNNKF